MSGPLDQPSPDNLDAEDARSAENREGVRRIGVFGGTFDPIHMGHLIAAQAVLEGADLDTILFVPNREPPHKTDQVITPVEHRVAMVELAIASNPWFRLDRCEVDRAGPSYAIETLRLIRSVSPAESEVLFILGCDALLDIPAWHLPQELISEFSFIAMDRPVDEDLDGNPNSANSTAPFGLSRSPDKPETSDHWQRVIQEFPRLPAKVRWVHVPRIGISSRLIRDRPARRLSLRYLVPREVESYIERHRLYA